MPKLFKIGSYWVYFGPTRTSRWSRFMCTSPGGAPNPGATKVWITGRGGCLLAHNHSHSPDYILRNLMAVIETRNVQIVDAWRAFFGEARFYC